MDSSSDLCSETSFSTNSTDKTKKKDALSPTGLGSEFNGYRFCGKNFILKSEFFGSQSQKSSDKPKPSFTNLLISYYCGAQKIEVNPTLDFASEEKIYVQPQKSVLIDYETKRNEICSKKESESLEDLSPKMYSNVDPKDIISLIKTKNGCRYFQSKIEKSKKFVNKVFFPYVKSSIVELMLDKFGNYVIQKMLESLNEKNFLSFMDLISSEFKTIAFSPYGTRVIQKIIERMQDKHDFGRAIWKVLFRYLRNNVAEMSINKNSNYIIRKLLESIDSRRAEFLLEEIKNSFLEISKTKFGCCAIVKCLLCVNEKQKKQITNLIIENTFELINNEFGNYIYQCLIMNSDSNTISNIYTVIYKEFFNLCKGKYSSNAIEKLFLIKEHKLMNVIASRLIKYKLKTVELIRDKYGFYIIKRLLNSSVDEYLKNKLLEIIFENKINVQSFFCEQKC